MKEIKDLYNGPLNYMDLNCWDALIHNFFFTKYIMEGYTLLSCLGP